jgi:hypothetical protein
MCAAVAAMFLWLTSLDCLTCCVTDQLSPTSQRDVTARPSHPNCCEEGCDAGGTPGRTTSEPDELAATGAPFVCPLLATSYGDAESPTPPIPDDAPALAPSVASLSVEVDIVAPPTEPPARVANRGDTYLRCRVLLI